MNTLQNILLVDDDEEDIDVFKITLANIDNSVNCQAFSDPVEAWYRLRIGDIDPDLIVLDLIMPGIHGKEFLKLVKSNDRLKEVPVIIFTAVTQFHAIEEMIKLGASDYFVKPNSYNALKNVLKTLFSKTAT